MSATHTRHQLKAESINSMRRRSILICFGAAESNPIVRTKMKTCHLCHSQHRMGRPDSAWRRAKLTFGFAWIHRQSRSPQRGVGPLLSLPRPRCPILDPRPARILNLNPVHEPRVSATTPRPAPTLQRPPTPLPKPPRASASLGSPSITAGCPLLPPRPSLASCSYSCVLLLLLLLARAAPSHPP